MMVRSPEGPVAHRVRTETVSLHGRALGRDQLGRERDVRTYRITGMGARPESGGSHLDPSATGCYLRLQKWP